MEAKSHIKLLSLAPYRHLFPSATVVDHTVKKGANVSDTVSFIPQVVKETSWQVERFVNQELRGLPLYDACQKLWQFVKYHIEYKKDERGSEQVRSPRRLIHDVKGDCDCFTTFIDTCLYTLGVKGITNRITKYKEDYFQHIYPVIPDGKGGHIIMDCVVDKFNYEEPYSEKKDYIMDLQFLDGIDENERFSQGGKSEGQYGYSDLLGDLGKLLKKRNAEKAAANIPAASNRQPIPKKPLIQKKQASATPKAKTSVGTKTLKTVNKVNKVNPATILLRAGILASMKLNVLKVAEKLKWGYATRELAQAKGMDMNKYDKLKDLLTKTEKIFFAAGGQPESLRKAMLTGHGNKNKEVAGISDETAISTLLGDIYESEFINGMDGFEGFGELGEPATAASLAAASTTMGSLAALLKAIGELFPKRPVTKQRSSNSDTNPNSNQEDEGNQESTANEDGEENSNETQEINEEDSVSPSESSDEAVEETPVEEFSEETTEGILSGTTAGLKAFWQKNKSWLLPVGISALAITGILIYTATQSSAPPTQKKQNALNGWSGSKKRSKKGGKKRRSLGKKTLIALM